MKTVIIAGFDNLTFTSADLLNPMEYKLVGFGTTIESAWNVYDENHNIIENLEEMPVKPIDVSVSYDPDMIILAAGSDEDNDKLKYKLYKANYQGEVISLRDFSKGFSARTAAIRKLSWRLESLGVEGCAADLGCYRGDISWQMNALMPDRKLYLFDTFTGYDGRDIAVEQENGYSDAAVNDYSLSPKELANYEERILSRMPYADQVVIKPGWFPETAYDLEEKFALVYIDTGLYQPTFKGIQYFFPRMSKGGVILVAGYEDGRSSSVRAAVDDLEKQYGAFLITPLCDTAGTIMIVRP
ncbi:MAG: TylF/MycF/NovP-related O-methyltransferase [Anaerovoracaceae bacterium]|jgi:O-methyltransferase